MDRKMHGINEDGIGKDINGSKGKWRVHDFFAQINEDDVGMDINGNKVK